MNKIQISTDGARNKMVVRVCMYLMLSFSLMLSAIAQETKTVSGKVTDSNNEPIPGATIYIEGTAQGTISSTDGSYNIMVEKGQVLIFSFIGYQNQSVTITEQTELNIQLTEDAVALDDVIVVAYGSQKKESVVGAIGQVKSQDLVATPVVNVSNAMVGQVAGLTAIQASGEIGNEQSTIRIRGVGTFAGDQNPLIIIDGIIRDQESFNSLDSYDIAGINVLKDASATAVYGVRGANGVIIVTTKRGRDDAGKPKVNFSANFGLVTATEIPQLVNSYQYANLKNEALINDGRVDDPLIFTGDELWKFQNNRDYTPDEVADMSFLSEEQKAVLNNTPALYYTNTNYMDEIFRGQLSPQQRYNVNISGGTKDISYYSSLGYTDQRSVTNDFGIDDAPTNVGSRKINFRSNFDIKSIKNTKIAISIAGTMKKGSLATNGENAGNVGERYRQLLMNAISQPPFSGYGVIDGKVITGFTGEKLIPDGVIGWRSPNAILLTQKMAELTQSSLNTSFMVDHMVDYITKGLKVRANFSYDQYLSKYAERDHQLRTYQVALNPSNPAERLFYSYGDQPTVYNENQGRWSKNRKFYLDTGLEYNRQFGKHQVTGLALLTAERFVANGLYYNVPKGFYGLVGRTTYNYDNRYLAEFNIGYNGSENFAEDKRFGYFPSFSLGWNISNEKFFPKNDIITWLKVRGSYGQTGNSGIGGSRFLFLPGTWSVRDANGNLTTVYSFGDSDGTYNNVVTPGAYENTVGNPDVTWEKKTSYNLGIESRFFKDKLSVVVDLFKEERNNILTRLQVVPGTVGLDSNTLPPVNIGKMTNKGYEVQADWNDGRGDWFYKLGLQLSYAVNKIDYMAEPPYEFDWMNDTGFALGQNKAYRTEGFYNTDEEVMNHPYNAVYGNRVQKGDLRLVDIDGDGQITQNDYVPTAYSNLPRFTFGGNIRFGFKGFEIYTLLTGTAQGTFRMDGYAAKPFSESIGSTPFAYMNERWTQERYDNGEAINFPRMSMAFQDTPNAMDNSFWLRSTDHLKVKIVELSYTFKRIAIGNNIGIESLKVFCNANNLHTWKFGDLPDGFEPELLQSYVSSQGVIYPLTRVYNIGVNIQF
ncbi:MULTISPECIES: SusC/RagA family TonB-linked outer membrane protein [unclassified Carboxylicivirga]|uniref:SusC/RagA family TonB-linked outer membrane protein n=1 Tax=Carboxylicivirga TaxID=1628153 RepID=UPI003D32B0A6